jgi:hypothetical protein
METEHNIRLTSAEISQLWASYMNDSFSICVLKYFINNVDDTEVRSVLEYALQLAQSHIPKLTAIFNKENYPIPHGFIEGEDVDINAPRLFSDSYYLRFLLRESNIGLNAISMAVALSVRTDVNTYFTECLSDITKLHTMTKEVLLSKGLYVRSPHIPIPKNVDYVKEKSFLAGFFGDVRPLSVLELTNLYSNIQRNVLGSATLIGFSQVAKDAKVKDYLVRGRDIAKKHVDVFGQKLKKDNLLVPMAWDIDITESTTFTFSDKIMMFQVTSLNAIGIAFYGASLATSPRRDIGLEYSRLMAEIGQYATDGAKIMIENGWLEQLPLASDRDELANKE